MWDTCPAPSSPTPTTTPAMVGTGMRNDDPSDFTFGMLARLLFLQHDRNKQ